MRLIYCPPPPPPPCARPGRLILITEGGWTFVRGAKTTFCWKVERFKLPFMFVIMDGRGKTSGAVWRCVGGYLCDV